MSISSDFLFDQGYVCLRLYSSKIKIST